MSKKNLVDFFIHFFMCFSNVWQHLNPESTGYSKDVMILGQRGKKAITQSNVLCTYLLHHSWILDPMTEIWSNFGCFDHHGYLKYLGLQKKPYVYSVKLLGKVWRQIQVRVSSNNNWLPLLWCSLAPLHMPFIHAKKKKEKKKKKPTTPLLSWD